LMSQGVTRLGTGGVGAMNWRRRRGANLE
jgi:hypothetical protein